MNITTKKQYIKLVEFLGYTLGPDYEVTLHDISNTTNSIIAIANGHISGRTIGAPLTSMALQIIANKSYEKDDYLINYCGITSNNKILRSSTFYIKNENGSLEGLLCINFDDSRYLELSKNLFQLCHPNNFVEQNIELHSNITEENRNLTNSKEQYQNSVVAITDSTISEVIADAGIPADRLTQDEKIEIVRILEQKGTFLLKGAVNQVAKALYSSPASIYRYLGKLCKEQEDFENKNDI